VSEATVVLDDVAALKAFYDPVRQRVLRELVRPRSVKELAEALQVPANRLYYHVRLLQQHGFVEVAAERRAGSNAEKLYQLAATRFEVPQELWAAGIDLARGPVAEELAEIFAAFHRSVLGSVPQDPDPETDYGIPRVNMWTGHLTRQRATKLAVDLGAATDRVLSPAAQTRMSKKNTLGVAVLIVVTPAELEES
jgi:DNA-binding transcriptional ArsR family regulator